MEQIKVIIAVATFNSGKYLEELLNSLFTQTYHNIEIVVRDDGSSDNTIDIVKRLCKTDSRIRLLNIENNLASAKSNFFTLLTNIPMNKGEYLMFCDADDVWKADKVEKTLKAIISTESDYSDTTPIIVHTDLEVVDENLKVIAPSFFDYEKLSPERNSLREILVQNNVTGCTVMINYCLREMVQETPHDAVMHDWWLALIAAAFGHISVLNEQTIFYRQHGGNQIGAYNSGSITLGLKKISDRAKMKNIYLSMYRQAACFLDCFKDLLNEEDKALVKGYAEMQYLSKLGKIRQIIKNKYYKNTLLRNIGQFLIV